MDTLFKIVYALFALAGSVVIGPLVWGFVRDCWRESLERDEWERTVLRLQIEERLRDGLEKWWQEGMVCRHHDPDAIRAGVALVKSDAEREKEEAEV